MKLPRFLRLLPSVVLVGAALLAAKTTGLVHAAYADAQQKVSALTTTPGLAGTAAKVFLPFVRTPTNLLKFALERSPAAPLLKEWRADFMAGGARRDLAIAKMLLGTGLGMTIYEGALHGMVSGSPPSDSNKARLLYADGWQPYSIKLGDQWYSYKRLDPFSTTIGVAADMATVPQGLTEKQQDDKTSLLVASIMGNLADKTWLSGVSDLTDALSDPGRYADNLKRRLVDIGERGPRDDQRPVHLHRSEIEHEKLRIGHRGLPHLRQMARDAGRACAARIPPSSGRQPSQPRIGAAGGLRS